MDRGLADEDLLPCQVVHAGYAGEAGRTHQHADVGNQREEKSTSFSRSSVTPRPAIAMSPLPAASAGSNSPRPTG